MTQRAQQKVLVIGTGGREHALVWKIRQSPLVSQVYCAPGNPGIGEIAELVDLKPEDIEGLSRFAQQEHIDLTVVGPEIPLSLGIVDTFEAHGLRIFGPTRQAAQLEASKAFTRELLQEQQVASPAFDVFTDPHAARQYVTRVGAPLVVKADGLAAGKGVLICPTLEEAYAAIDKIMQTRVFGEAGERIVIEEFLDGEEVSFLAFSDGTTVLPLASSQDHKRIFDGDQGPNTGGMGAYSPAPVMTPELSERILDEILYPTVRGLRQRGIVYKGILYAGLMMTQAGPKVIEFNARFGDPECQPLMLRLQSDLVEIIDAAIDERLSEVSLSWDARSAVCVVLAAAGYPGSYEKGRPIAGLESLHTWSDGVVFHAGTAKKDDAFVTQGGRVLGVTGTGRDLQAALSNTYQAVEKISWPGMHFRHDIGQRALQHKGR
jgi:phosphoribosylamine--glycine ligase